MRKIIYIANDERFLESNKIIVRYNQYFYFKKMGHNIIKINIWDYLSKSFKDQIVNIQEMEFEKNKFIIVE